MGDATTDDTETRAGALQSGAVSTRHLVFFVVAAAAPLTVMAGFAPLAFYLGGESAPVGYLAAGAVYLIFAVGFTAMSKHVSNAGAFYAYIGEGLGRTVGGGSAVLAYVGYTLGQTGFCAAAGLFASNALADLSGIEVSWGVCAVLIALAVALVAYGRVDVGARVLALLLLAEVGLLILLTVAILVGSPPDGLSFDGFDPSTWSLASMGSLFVITFVVYIGFEQTAVYAEEARDPRRTVPRATYIAVVVLAATYTVVSWALLMGIGPSDLEAALAESPDTLVFGINQQYLGSLMTDVLQVLIVTSFIAGVLALHNAGARYLYSLGRDRLLPSALGRTGEQSSSPTTAVVVQGVVAVGALVGFGLSDLDPYTEVVVWTNTPTLVAVLVLQLLTSVAVLRFFARDPRGEGRWHRTIAPAASVVLLAGVLYLVLTQMDLLTGLHETGNLLLMVPLATAFVVGAVRGRMVR